MPEEDLQRIIQAAEFQQLQDKKILIMLGWTEGLYGWWFHLNSPGVKFTLSAALSIERDHKRRKMRKQRIQKIQEDFE